MRDGLLHLSVDRHGVGARSWHPEAVARHAAAACRLYRGPHLCRFHHRIITAMWSWPSACCSIPYRSCPTNWPAALISLVVGTLCFAALGMALTGLCRNSETVQAVSNATLLPSPSSRMSSCGLAGIARVDILAADLFPLKHFALAFADGFKPLMDGNGFAFSGVRGDLCDRLARAGDAAVGQSPGV